MCVVCGHVNGNRKIAERSNRATVSKLIIYTSKHSKEEEAILCEMPNAQDDLMYTTADVEARKCEFEYKM